MGFWNSPSTQRRGCWLPVLPFAYNHIAIVLPSPVAPRGHSIAACTNADDLEMFSCIQIPNTGGPRLGRRQSIRKQEIRRKHTPYKDPIFKCARLRRRVLLILRIYSLEKQGNRAHSAPKISSAGAQFDKRTPRRELILSSYRSTDLLPLVLLRYQNFRTVAAAESFCSFYSHFTA
jgi:hypothetical protein